MADITDVANALVDIIDVRLHPNGVGQPGAYSPPVKVYAGWPDPEQLRTDLDDVSPGVPSFLHVSVWKLEMERDTTRYPDEWMELPIQAATYAASVLGNTITISGAAPAEYEPQNIAAEIGGIPHAFVVTAADGDTAADVAAALAAEIVAEVPGVVAVGADIIVPQPYRVGFARVGVIGQVTRELARSETGFQVTVWANTHGQRTALAKRLEPTLAAAIRIPMPDGSVARMTRRGSTDMDKAERQGAYRRDLVYSVEYAVTETMDAPQIVAMETELKNPEGDIIAASVE